MAAVQQDLEVVDRRTGEVLDVRAAKTVQLAEWTTNLRDLLAELAEAAEVVSDELVRRLDRSAEWTIRVGEPTDRQWEITAPSPTAGTDVYDDRVLENELKALVARDTIDTNGAAGALRRSLTIVLTLPLELDLHEAEAAAQLMTFSVDDVATPLVKAEATRSVVLAGVNKLRKVPGTGAALDRAKLEPPKPKRRAKVTEKVKS